MKIVAGGFPYLKFGVFDGFDGELVHGISMRAGGVSKGAYESLNLSLLKGDDVCRVRENYEIFCNEVGVPLRDVVLGYQEHNDKVLRVDEAIFERENDEDYGFKESFEGVDGFLTNVKAVPLLVRFADCQGGLFFDPALKVVGAVHCGWRGNVKNVFGKAIRKMREEFGCDPGDILVGISPSLGPCCANFSDPFNELPSHMHKYVNEGRVDLWECSFDQLVSAGVPGSNIEIARRCTVCENGEFFSYRGGKKVTGHLGGVVMLV